MTDLVDGCAAKWSKEKRTGIVISAGDRKSEVRFYDRDFIDPETSRIDNSELVRTSFVKIGTDDARDLITYTRTVRDLTKGVMILGESKRTNRYVLTASDMNIGIKKLISGADVEDIVSWCYALKHMRFDIGIYNVEDDKESFEEGDLIEYLCGRIFLEYDNICSWEDHETEILKDLLKETSQICGRYIRTGSFPYGFYEEYIRSRDAEQCPYPKYKKAVEKLVRHGDLQALKVRGYLRCSGLGGYEQDYVKAREDLDRFYRTTGIPYAANTLGIISYYGYANGGIPDYPSAFRYFSIGHAAGIYESTYMLADMFGLGLSVPSNPGIANELCYGVYTKTFERFRRGSFEVEFANASKRMGDCYFIGWGCERDVETSYAYYLQAKFAMNLIGDTKDERALESVEMMLQRIRDVYKDHTKFAVFTYPSWIRWAQYGDRRAQITLKTIDGGKLLLEITPLRGANDGEGIPQMLVVIPSADYCSLKSRMIVTTAEKSVFESFGSRDTIVFNRFEYDKDEKKTTFWHDDIKVGSITTDYYVISAGHGRH